MLLINILYFFLILTYFSSAPLIYWYAQHPCNPPGKFTYQALKIRTKKFLKLYVEETVCTFQGKLKFLLVRGFGPTFSWPPSQALTMSLSWRLLRSTVLYFLLRVDFRPHWLPPWGMGRQATPCQCPCSCILCCFPLSYHSAPTAQLLSFYKTVPTVLWMPGEYSEDGKDQKPPFLNFWMAQMETKRWSLSHCHSPCPQYNAWRENRLYVLEI